MNIDRLEKYRILNQRDSWSIWNGQQILSLKEMPPEKIEMFDRDYTDMINTFVAKDEDDTKIIAIKKVLAGGRWNTFMLVRAMMKSLYRSYSGRDSWNDDILFDTIIDGDVPFKVDCEFIEEAALYKGAMIIMGVYTVDPGTDSSISWQVEGRQYSPISLPWRLSREGVLRLPYNVILTNKGRFQIQADTDIELIGVKISTGSVLRSCPRIVRIVKK